MQLPNMAGLTKLADAEVQGLNVSVWAQPDKMPTPDMLTVLVHWKPIGDYVKFVYVLEDGDSLKEAITEIAGMAYNEFIAQVNTQLRRHKATGLYVH